MANHTSPIDVIILASDGCYAMVNVPLLQEAEKRRTLKHASIATTS